MNNEIEKAKENFPNGKIPNLIYKFYSFLVDKKPSGFLDYETIYDTQQYLHSLVNKNVSSEFLPFYVDNSHAFFSIWVLSDNKDLEQQPIIYINTEGTFTVCADNLKNFLCLISLNLAARISVVFNDNVFYKKMGWDESILNPYEEFNNEKLKEIEAYNIQNYSDYSAFRDHVKNEMSFQCDKNPVRIIEKAFTEIPNLEDYIRSKDGFIRDPRK